MGEVTQFLAKRGSGRDHRTTSPQNRQDPPPPAIDLFTFHALPPCSARWRCPHFMNFCSCFKFAFLRGTSGRKESRFHGGAKVLVDGALVFWWDARAGVCDLRSGVLRSFGIAGAIRREV